MFSKLLKLMVIVGVTGLGYAAIQRPDYDDTSNPEFLNPSWMAIIPNDQPLSEVTMPGTHNTMALYGGVYAECQTWSLPSQLRAGIRFLDIRVRHVKGNLTIHHGVSYQRAHFGHVLDGVADFLGKYPTETVLMRVKEEFSETDDIYGAVVDYIHRYGQWDLLWHSRLVPTMGEARGKLIVLQNFSGPDLGMRYDSLDIADDWKVPTLLHVEEKWRSVYEHLEVAPAGDKAQIFLTYSSGAGVFAYPRAIAQRINAQLYNYLRLKTDLNQRFGIVCMDFPAAPIIQVIIDFQLKEKLKRGQVFNLVPSKAMDLRRPIQQSRVSTWSGTDMNQFPETDVRPQRSVLISVAAVVNIIWWMFMIVAIGVGATHVGRCPVQPNIPIYLIVLGVASLLSLSMTYIRSIWEEGILKKLTTVCMTVLHVFSFCWFIAGTVWVYSVHHPSFTPGATFCNKKTYQFAFVVTTLLWVLFAVVFICGGCFIIVTCCATVRVRHRLTPNRYSAYGATDFQDDTVGTV